MLPLLWLFALCLGNGSMALSMGRSEHPTIEEHQFYCQALGRAVSYSIYLPERSGSRQDSIPLVLLLHGDGRNHRTIVSDEQCRADLLKRKIAVVFPNGDRGWYLDSRADAKNQYQSMLLELLTHIRQTYPVSQSGGHTGIGGWSMGGFGAMHFTETYPQQVKAVATIIGLLDFPNPALPTDQNYPVSPVFGADTTAWSTVNCLKGAEKLAGKSILLIAGKQAFDYSMNQQFHRRLQALGIPHTYFEREGKHDFPMVRQSLPMLLDFMEQTLRKTR